MVRMLASLFSVLVYSSTVLAGGTDSFFNLIELKRNSEGQVYELMIRPSLGASPVKSVTSDLQVSFMRQQDLGLMHNPIPLSTKKLPGEEEVNQFRKLVERILKKLQDLNLEEALKNENLARLLGGFEQRLAEATRDFQVIARPYESNYFHSNKVMKRILELGFKEVRDNFDGPIAGIANYIIWESVRNLVDRRTYYQNFVVHYLLNYSPEELGLTAQEAAWVMSSIRESFIAWDKPWDSWDIEEEWDHHGVEHYDRLADWGLENWKHKRTQYDSYGDMFNFSFAPVIENGTPMIKNTINTQNRYSEKMSTAFNYKRPCRQIAYRFVLRMVEFGMSQTTMPRFMRRRLNRFISSLYAPQRIQEGYLAAYMLEHDMPEVDYILTQGFNILIALDHQPRIHCNGGF